ncbi:hypothetical protein EV182_000624 [Spiromyces aspiralis]|uniref:Uncharacterized protein n=1 Tax=Spiromyces aspiralis TaxID=68401 RepID=A0ACC1HU94_9FUNG|nr:hypothetical protein EV182_000624 [Spiromyces aspiralis]
MAPLLSRCWLPDDCMGCLLAQDGGYDSASDRQLLTDDGALRSSSPANSERTANTALDSPPRRPSSPVTPLNTRVDDAGQVWQPLSPCLFSPSHLRTLLANSMIHGDSDLDQGTDHKEPIAATHQRLPPHTPRNHRSFAHIASSTPQPTLPEPTTPIAPSSDYRPHIPSQLKQLETPELISRLRNNGHSAAAAAPAAGDITNIPRTSVLAAAGSQEEALARITANLRKAQTLLSSPSTQQSPIRQLVHHRTSALLLQSSQQQPQQQIGQLSLGVGHTEQHDRMPANVRGSATPESTQPTQEVTQETPTFHGRTAPSIPARDNHSCAGDIDSRPATIFARLNFTHTLARDPNWQQTTDSERHGSVLTSSSQEDSSAMALQPSSSSPPSPPLSPQMCQSRCQQNSLETLISHNAECERVGQGLDIQTPSKPQGRRQGPFGSLLRYSVSDSVVMDEEMAGCSTGSRSDDDSAGSEDPSQCQQLSISQPYENVANATAASDDENARLPDTLLSSPDLCDIDLNMLPEKKSDKNLGSPAFETVPPPQALVVNVVHNVQFADPSLQKSQIQAQDQAQERSGSKVISDDSKHDNDDVAAAVALEGECSGDKCGEPSGNPSQNNMDTLPVDSSLDTQALNAIHRLTQDQQQYPLTLPVSHPSQPEHSAMIAPKTTQDMLEELDMIEAGIISPTYVKIDQPATTVAESSPQSKSPKSLASLPSPDATLKYIQGQQPNAPVVNIGTPTVQTSAFGGFTTGGGKALPSASADSLKAAHRALGDMSSHRPLFTGNSSAKRHKPEPTTLPLFASNSPSNPDSKLDSFEQMLDESLKKARNAKARTFVSPFLRSKLTVKTPSSPGGFSTPVMPRTAGPSGQTEFKSPLLSSTGARLGMKRRRGMSSIGAPGSASPLARSKRLPSTKVSTPSHKQNNKSCDTETAVDELAVPSRKILLETKAGLSLDQGSALDDISNAEAEKLLKQFGGFSTAKSGVNAKSINFGGKSGPAGASRKSAGPSGIAANTHVAAKDMGSLLGNSLKDMASADADRLLSEFGGFATVAGSRPKGGPTPVEKTSDIVSKAGRIVGIAGSAAKVERAEVEEAGNNNSGDQRPSGAAEARGYSDLYDQQSQSPQPVANTVPDMGLPDGQIFASKHLAQDASGYPEDVGSPADRQMPQTARESRGKANEANEVNGSSSESGPNTSRLLTKQRPQPTGPSPLSADSEGEPANSNDSTKHSNPADNSESRRTQRTPTVSPGLDGMPKYHHIVHSIPALASRPLTGTMGSGLVSTPVTSRHPKTRRGFTTPFRHQSSKTRNLSSEKAPIFPSPSAIAAYNRQSLSQPTTPPTSQVEPEMRPAADYSGSETQTPLRFPRPFGTPISRSANSSVPSVTSAFRSPLLSQGARSGRQRRRQLFKIKTAAGTAAGSSVSMVGSPLTPTFNRGQDSVTKSFLSLPSLSQRDSGQPDPRCRCKTLRELYAEERDKCASEELPAGDLSLLLMEVGGITPRISQEFRFVTDRYPMGWGHSNAREEMVRQQRCLATVATEDWVKNHYRWVVWQLSKLVRRFPRLHREFWSPHAVIQRLLYRYEREYNRGERSVIKRICEKDGHPSRAMVLCVSDINSSEGSGEGVADLLKGKEIRVTDGWYELVAQCDMVMSRAIRESRLKVGDKIAVCGAKLVGLQDGITPLELMGSELMSSVKLVLSSNSARIMPWDTKLGLQGPGFRLFKSLSSLRENGGYMGGVIDVVVIRKYPMCYMETMADGAKVVRTARAEQKRDSEYQDARELKVQSILYSKMDETSAIMVCGDAREKTTLQGTSSKGNGKRLQRHASDVDGETLFGQLQVETDQNAFIEDLSPTKRRILEDYIREQREEINRQIVDEVESIQPPRQVVPFFKLRVCDYPAHPYLRPERRDTHGIITVWGVSKDVHDQLKEGGRYQITGLNSSMRRLREVWARSPTIWLSTHRSLLFEPKQTEPSIMAESAYVARKSFQVHDLDALQHYESQSVALQPGSEVDISGIYHNLSRDEAQVDPYCKPQDERATSIQTTRVMLSSEESSSRAIIEFPYTTFGPLPNSNVDGRTSSKAGQRAAPPRTTMTVLNATFDRFDAVSSTFIFSASEVTDYRISPK